MKSLPFVLVTIVYLFKISACSSNVKDERDVIVQDTTVYAAENYSSVVIDSVLLHNFLSKDTTLHVFARDINAFYDRRNYQGAWFAADSLSLQAKSFLLRLKDFSILFNDTTLISKALVSVIDSLELNTDYLRQNPAQKPLLDINMTAAFFKYATKEYYGSEKQARDLEWYIPRKKKNYNLLLNALIQSDSSYSIYEPVNNYYSALKSALIKYRQIELNGGFPLIDSAGKTLKLGDTSSFIQPLKKYLLLTEDITTNNSESVFDSVVLRGVVSYQTRMGIKPTGTLDPITRQSMNVSVRERIRQMIINMERMRWVPDSIASDYLLVNIPEFKLHVMEHGGPLWSMNVVVGKEANATTIFSDELTTVVFSPYWNIPQSIIVKEILPILKRNPGYLIRKNMEVISGTKKISPYSVNWKRYSRGVPFTIREKPGKNNSLGLVKFLFPNHYNIYMHDTPAKYLFEQNSRAFSHGCIRLAEPEKLANYIFRNDTTITSDTIKAWMSAGEEKYVRVKPPIPVFIGYFTAWVSHEGKLNFRKDIYGHDQKLAAEVFSK
jgi:murein L,D-transpeptidase YcbB/YkuD